MKKIDGIISVVIGFLIGLFFFIILKSINIKFPFSWALMIVFPPLSLLGMFIVSLIGKKILFIFQMGKFLLVGALNTFVDLGVLNILMWAFGIVSGAYYSLFKAISFLMATTNSYFWNKHWTFRKKEEVFAPKEFSKFLIVTTIGLLINVSIASFIVNVIGPKFGISEKIWPTAGAFIAVLFAWVWNFSSSKFIVFKK